MTEALASMWLVDSVCTMLTTTYHILKIIQQVAKNRKKLSYQITLAVGIRVKSNYLTLCVSFSICIILLLPAKSSLIQNNNTTHFITEESLKLTLHSVLHAAAIDNVYTAILNTVVNRIQCMIQFNARN